MDAYKSLIGMIMLSVLIVSCGVKKENSKELKQAFAIHQEAIEVRKKISVKLDQIKATEDTSFLAAIEMKLDSIAQHLKTWDGQMVAVPGFEEKHEHGADCRHHHDRHSDLTPKQYVEIQEHLLQEIQTIAKETESLSRKN